ncbi:alpha-N-arabinofuranosidase [Mucilaginibacter agri]|uniref:non-reducing end alpha-L-arabinofuranosidase n=1 Tax=Mucilaginibacter agri TaxID=2695265 RepID=A0A965ZEC7_9SPHI|nr:alpha-L-arabinofuranosidase C-terminal domain-containing protein [Mucilaginibacter agri]NCD68136.1 alpha-N-arabinofuranosidase [Mucilaginibacter agri]
MKLKSIKLLAALLLGSSLTYAQTTIAISASSNTSSPVISKYIYSHFAEHLGRGIYDGFYVGDTSKIPNTNGVRNDIIAALKKMKIPSLRWPGGCFADTYHWKDGIGPKDKRPAIVNKWWGNAIEDNSFGTHDFLNMCELLGAEPYLAGNVGSGTVQELADWVQYVGSDNKNPMSDLRKANGREKPWDVKFWGVGNEAWGCGGNMTPEYYVNEFRKYSTFMTGSGKIFRVASGASDDDYHWTETLMKGIPQSLIEGIAVHHYAVNWAKKTSATNYTEAEYFTTMKSALLMDTLVTHHAAIMDKYDPKKKIALVVDEWGGWYDVEPGTNPGFLYQQNTMRDAMIAGVTLNIFNNHADRVRMANLAQCVNVLQAVILTDKQKMILTPTYHVLEMYNVHQDATLLPLTIKSDDYAFGSEKLPAVSASASRDKNGVVHISLVNIDPNHPHNLSLKLDGEKFKGLTGRILASAKVQDHNTFDQPDKIKPEVFKSASIKDGNISIALPATSVVVLTLN